MNAIWEARDMLKNLTPLLTDCGELCGHACCKMDKDAGGLVWLWPGEEEADMPWAETLLSRLPVTELDAEAVRCAAPCAREDRPFLCRLFPLTPYYSEKKQMWDVRMDRRAWMLCPLCGYGIRGLNPSFVKAARAAVRLLAQDPANEAFLQALAREEDAYRFSL